MWHLIRAVLLIFPTLIWDICTWVFKYSKHPEKYPLEKRYFRTRKLILKANKVLKVDTVVVGK